MNKDVIYIEPEDDITDIITKIENSKEKIVALVPPKKAGVFRSVVNIKLIAKSSAAAEKTVVLVTTDPSIVKLAAATKLPVTKNLQTAPTIPSADGLTEETVKENLVEESDGTVETKEDVAELNESEAGKEAEEEKSDKKDDEDDAKGDADEDEEERDDKKSSKDKKAKAKKATGGLAGWFATHRKLAIIGGISGVLLALLMVWAFVIAPAATVTVGIRTTSNNFSESVSFVATVNEESAEEGKFYLEEKKIESVKEVNFEATGTKNVGEKATGEVIVIATVSADGGTVQVKSGDTFTNSGLSFTANNSVTMSFDGKDKSVCGNVDDNTTIKEFDKQGCKIYAKVKVTATEPGTKYNISARETGWDTTAPVSVYSTNAMSGGTDQTLTVVQQSDIDKAKAELSSADENINKEKLFEEIGDDKMVISSSFTQTAAEVVATPAVGEEVKEGVKPTLKATTRASVYVIDKVKVEEFVTTKAKISDDQKIYEMKDPFIENFMKTDSGYTGKLKTSYMTGPRLTTSSVVDMVRGRGFGDAQHVLKDIDGVTEVRIDGSFPWVNSISNDTNKITVEIEVKDQNGNKVELKDEGKEDSKNNQSEKDTETESTDNEPEESDK